MAFMRRFTLIFRSRASQPELEPESAKPKNFHFERTRTRHMLHVKRNLIPAESHSLSPDFSATHVASDDQNLRRKAGYLTCDRSQERDTDHKTWTYYYFALIYESTRTAKVSRSATSPLTPLQ